TAVYELCPTALVFGMWGSPEKPGGLGAKFERTYVSEIVAVDVERVESREGFRIDPLGSRSAVLVKPKEDGSFGLADTKTKDALPPAKINHGNIPFQTPNGGLRCRYAEQVTVVSLGALRKLRFPVDGRDDPHRNDLGRTVLAAIGLCAGIFASEAGTSLRSRCHLWPVGGREWELLERPGQETRKFRMNGEEASALLGEAIKAAKQNDCAWDSISNWQCCRCRCGERARMASSSRSGVHGHGGGLFRSRRRCSRTGGARVAGAAEASAWHRGQRGCGAITS